MDRSVPFGRMVTRDHPLRHPAGVHRRGQGRGRGRGRGPETAVPAQPAGRLLRGGGRAGDHAQAAHRQHARRTSRRRPALPAAPCHRRRRQSRRGHDVPEGGHDHDRFVHGRGRLPFSIPHTGHPSARRRGASGVTRPEPHRDDRVETVDGVTIEDHAGGAVRGMLSSVRRSGPRTTGSRQGVGEEVGKAVLQRWGRRSSPGSSLILTALARQVDWVAKRRLIDSWTERHLRITPS